jgi:hypothetical protein
MAKAKKAKRSSQRKQTYSPAAWAPIEEAFARVKALTGTSALAEHQLLKDLRTRLPSAFLFVEPDQSRIETFQLLKFAEWNSLTVSEISESGRISIGGLHVSVPPLLVVSRKHLDKLYPAGAGIAEPSHDPEPLRRKPGRKPREDWKLFVAAKLWDLRKAGKPVPTAADLAQFCENELGYQPDISHLQKWLRELLG